MGLQGMQMVRVAVGEYQCRAHHLEHTPPGHGGTPPWWEGEIIVVKRAGE